MKIILVSKCSLDIEQYVEFEMSVLISPSKSLNSLRWVTFKISALSISVMVTLFMLCGSKSHMFVYIILLKITIEMHQNQAILEKFR